mmetsp:Transcript_3177/g.3612  ORF Transcript_3177/g.3612 Transcript_3177/m.3612 type:complete len:102 (-) Transcript_3177:156-461(-)
MITSVHLTVLAFGHSQLWKFGIQYHGSVFSDLRLGEHTIISDSTTSLALARASLNMQPMRCSEIFMSKDLLRSRAQSFIFRRVGWDADPHLSSNDKAARRT